LEHLEELLVRQSVILDYETTKIDSSTQLLLLGCAAYFLEFIALLVRRGPNNSFERAGLFLKTYRTSLEFDWEAVEEQTVALG
jgi:hypothetical protein